jgi:hypothetical protein
LYFQIRQAQPSLNQSGVDVNVLYSGICEIYLFSEENTPPHSQSLFVEAVSECMVSEKQDGENEWKERQRQDGANEI